MVTVRKQKQFEKYCLKQRVCGVLLVSTPNQQTASNLATRHRGVQFVIINTTYHSLEDAHGQPFTGTVQGKPPAVLHLFKRRKGGALSIVSYNGAFTSHNMVKFVDSHLLTSGEDTEGKQLLLQKNALPEVISLRKGSKKKKKRDKQKKKKREKKDEKKAAEEAEEKRQAAQRRRERRRRERMDREAESYIPQVCMHTPAWYDVGEVGESESMNIHAFALKYTCIGVKTKCLA